MTRGETATDDPVRKGGTVGQYRLVREIGVGGMASVWCAEHTRMGRPVAVKFLTLGLGAKVRRDRFLREAKIVASIRHRNVVGILDYGDLSDGRAYMVLELLDGESLHERLARKKPRMTTDEVLSVSMDTLSGLSAAHALGVVHRDIKPSNIFLVREEDGVHAKLLDFGISISSDADTSGPALTQTGAIVGTPEYMSPEQGRTAKDIDARTDVWSMGVVMYEALTGVKPFAAENFGDILIAVTSKDVPPAHQVAKGIDPRLSAILARAMSRDRAQRYKSAAEMRNALAEVVGTGRISTPDAKVAAKAPPTHSGMTRRRGEGVVRPQRGRIVALGLVALLLGLGAGAWIFFPDECVALYASVFGSDETDTETPSPTQTQVRQRPAKRAPVKRAPIKRAPLKRNPR